MEDDFDEGRPKKERSPSYPFISLSRAVDRASALYEGHRREPTRLAVLAQTWGYSPASSGLQQTVAALKQFGLLEDEGSRGDRKVRVTDLARRILSDLRPGAREAAIVEAAQRPKIIAEYLPRWLPTRPSDAHCISELHFDRGFSQPAAKLFLKVFDETVDYAGLRENDTVSETEQPSDSLSERDESEEAPASPAEQAWKPLLPPPAVRGAGTIPLSERLQVVTTGNQLTVSAALVSGREVDKLIRILQANKALLDDDEEETGDANGADLS